jgi:hypothetical protein
MDHRDLFVFITGLKFIVLISFCVKLKIVCFINI